MERVAVVGAGAAGLGAAYALRAEPVAVTVFERRDGPCGRVATVERAGRVVDVGANYLTDDDERVNRVVRRLDEGLVDVTDPVWTFDRSGEVAPGRDGDGHKWTYRSGLATLGTRLQEAADAEVAWETPVRALDRRADEWWLDAGGERRGPYDAVVLTPPAPRTADLLADAGWDHPVRETLAAGAAEIPYRSVVSVVLGYPFELERPYYALVDVDAAHPVGWVGREECKPGHVPAGESVLVVQMGAEWSARNLEMGDDETVRRAADHAASLLEEERLANPSWSVVERWRHALPDAALAVDRAPAADAGLHLAGDWVGGAARVHRALRSGLEAGRRLAGGGSAASEQCD